jgi:hypothetical protein
MLDIQQCKAILSSFMVSRYTDREMKGTNGNNMISNFDVSDTFSNGFNNTSSFVT